jgi:uncharacterized protein YfbU (UPF0304 family)
LIFFMDNKLSLMETYHAIKESYESLSNKDKYGKLKISFDGC